MPVLTRELDKLFKSALVFIISGYSPALPRAGLGIKAIAGIPVEPPAHSPGDSAFLEPGLAVPADVNLAVSHVDFQHEIHLGPRYLRDTRTL